MFINKGSSERVEEVIECLSKKLAGMFPQGVGWAGDQTCARPIACEPETAVPATEEIFSPWEEISRRLLLEYRLTY